MGVYYADVADCRGHQLVQDHVHVHRAGDVLCPGDGLDVPRLGVLAHVHRGVNPLVVTLESEHGIVHRNLLLPGLELFQQVRQVEYFKEAFLNLLVLYVLGHLLQELARLDGLLPLLHAREDAAHADEAVIGQVQARGCQGIVYLGLEDTVHVVIAVALVYLVGYVLGDSYRGSRLARRVPYGNHYGVLVAACQGAVHLVADGAFCPCLARVYGLEHGPVAWDAGILEVVLDRPGRVGYDGREIELLVVQGRIAVVGQSYGLFFQIIFPDGKAEALDCGLINEPVFLFVC